MLFILSFVNCFDFSLGDLIGHLGNVDIFSPVKGLSASLQRELGPLGCAFFPLSLSLFIQEVAGRSNEGCSCPVKCTTMLHGFRYGSQVWVCV